MLGLFSVHFAFHRHAAFKAALIGAVLLSAFTRFSAADESDKGQIVLMLAGENQKEAFSPVVQAVRGQLSDFPVEFRTMWVNEFPSELSEQEELSTVAAEKSGASMVFWCDFSRADRLNLYLAIPKLNRVFVRRLDGSGPGGAPETLGIIVRNSVDAVLHGALDQLESELMVDAGPGEVGFGDFKPLKPKKPKKPKIIKPKIPVSEEPKEKKPRENNKIASAESESESVAKHRLYGLVAYELDVLSAEHPPTHGISLIFDVFLKKDWHVFAGYTFAFPIRVKERGFEMELIRHPVFWGARYGTIFRRLELGGGVACLLDYTQDKVNAVGENMSARSHGGEVIFSLLPFFQLSVRLFYTLELYVNLGMDIPFRRPNYVVESEVPGVRIKVFGTLPVRPVGRIGFMMGFL